MKLVKIFSGLIIMILVLYFLMQNTSLVSVDLIFVEYDNVQVAVVMLGALAVGNKNRHLSDELNDLRNAAIDEEIYDSEDKDE